MKARRDGDGDDRSIDGKKGGAESRGTAKSKKQEVEIG